MGSTFKRNWLKHGDRNSRFFHSSATKRRRTNLIQGLYNSRDEWCEDDHSLENIAIDYFDNLFSSSYPSHEDIEKVTCAVQPVVDEQMNQTLCAPFTVDDI